MWLITGLIITAIILGGLAPVTEGASLIPLILVLFFIFGVIGSYPQDKEYTTKEYKTEQVRTEIIGGDTTVYFKIVKIK